MNVESVLRLATATLEERVVSMFEGYPEVLKTILPSDFLSQRIGWAEFADIQFYGRTTMLTF